VTNKLSRVENFIWRKIGDDIVVIKEDGVSLYVLNKTAAHIWEMCNGDNEPDEIAASLSERFDVTPEEVSADVKDTISELEGLGLLARVEGA
jgi:hypothetical protein